MAKVSLVAGEITQIYKSLGGNASTPTQLDFRIDPEADDTVVVRYAQNREAAKTIANSVAFPSDDWMPLLTNEVKSNASLIRGGVYYAISDVDVDVFYEVSGAE